MDFLVSDILFYVFATLAILASMLVVGFRNPVSSAMAMALAFAFTAAVLFGLGAYFLGIVQILVYAGAIIVLFLFVIMMVDIKKEEKRETNVEIFSVGTLVAFVLALVIAAVSFSLPGSRDNFCLSGRICSAMNELSVGKTDSCSELTSSSICSQQSAEEGIGGKLPVIDPKKNADVVPSADLKNRLQQGEFPDTALVGCTMFKSYNIQFTFIGLVLMIGAVGAVSLGRRTQKQD